ncbi:XPG domain containing-domain-containing protein [Tuber borchii]|uniref:XPG domain containing-domain-containing protein n=1 Tax=Tuber borchii TaxID=42251 RepID=A0A2T6ZW40_TUBBO|nr:XPG domain containing-domain-containing protein [Tuber borchii]
MGIRHLYTNLRPYARPATLEPDTKIFIDGPGLAHHVYDQCFCAAATPQSSDGDNPWDSVIPYAVLQDGVIKYLRMLEGCGIYFDGALPPSKRPTRISRLEESLGKLRTFHASYAHTLPQCARGGGGGGGGVVEMFSEKAVYTPKSSPLSSPPFIVAATLAALSRSEYAGRTSTVPGEAEGYAARDAIATGGVVLTSDSDLLLFRGDGGGAGVWGVVMFKDVEVNFSTGKISTVLFRPDDIAKGFDLELAFLGYLSHCDPRASFSTIRERCARIAERGKSGASVEGEMGRKWREFAAGYAFPEGDGGRLVEPRIAEVLSLRGCVGRKKEMFLPMLWEDTSRASAWDVGREVRAVAYSLLFPGEMSLEEISRRGHGISGTPVEILPAREVKRKLNDILSESRQGNWIARHVLRQIVGAFATRNQPPPNTSILESCASLLSGGNRPYITTTTKKQSASARWTWERIQIFAMLQAAWYSLLLLSEVLKETTDTKTRLEVLPIETLDSRRFTDALPGVGDRGLVKEVLAGYFEEEVEEEVEGREAEAKAVEGAPEGEARDGVWKEVGGKARKKKRRGTMEEAEVEATVIGGGNMFAALVG